ncbi:DUF4123 domain-containing protein [Chitiniphilus eburneus]|uniref:DUF4123 domain-containing protein n=1 Tax=Chitiniphilus eburneus TaxID=2571148 RepID=A0A4U0QR71_9NEIS|nr:DUF4123 domain-containing protein [Chitiniphilus eburneus]TJZ78714.1 DUF4123 domain-containing protein [Chitiniphilus eburneus]
MSSRAPQTLLAQHHYAIVDRAAVNPAPWHQGLPLHPLVPSPLQSDADKMPALLPLGALTAPQRELVCDNLLAAQQGEDDVLLACLLEAPTADFGQLMQHLTTRLLLRAPQGRALLRYYDPRVFAHLSWILNREQLAELFGPITRWTCYLKGSWTHLPCAQTPVPGRYWGVDRQQRLQLDRVGLINTALSCELASDHPGWADLAALAIAARQADAALSTAQQRYGLQDEADLIEFASHALRHGAVFHLDDRIQQLLARVRAGQTTYADACALIEAPEWAGIAGHLAH